MKKNIILILTMVTILALSSCGVKNENLTPIDSDNAIEISTKKMSHFWGSKYVCKDGSTIYFNEDGTFKWYQDEANSDAVKSGTYSVSFGEDAKKLLITDYKEYGVTEEELDEYAKRNEGDELHSAENLTFMVLVTTSLKSGGVEKSTSSKTTPYYGYSNETVFDAVNMNSGNYATFNVVE